MSNVVKLPCPLIILDEVNSRLKYFLQQKHSLDKFFPKRTKFLVDLAEIILPGVGNNVHLRRVGAQELELLHAPKREGAQQLQCQSYNYLF
jgi:hypothetical protein